MAQQDATPICYINGKRIFLPPGRGEVTLLTFLRGGREGENLKSSQLSHGGADKPV
jgi:hypothetical protein